MLTRLPPALRGVAGDGSSQWRESCLPCTARQECQGGEGGPTAATGGGGDDTVKEEPGSSRRLAELLPLIPFPDSLSRGTLLHWPSVCDRGLPNSWCSPCTDRHTKRVAREGTSALPRGKNTRSGMVPPQGTGCYSPRDAAGGLSDDHRWVRSGYHICHRTSQPPCLEDLPDPRQALPAVRERSDSGGKTCAYHQPRFCRPTSTQVARMSCRTF